jgi:putative transposase
VRLWRKHWHEGGLAGLHIELRARRPRNIENEQMAELVDTALEHPPESRTHWSVRSLAVQTGMSADSVHRYISLLGLQPHRSRSFKLSSGPFFVEKVRDIFGLYLSSPENALALCVEEKREYQALERTPPVLPMRLGYVEGITRDYKHRGTTLFAPLDAASGEVLA